MCTIFVILLSLIHLSDSYLNHVAPLESFCGLEWPQLGVPKLLEYFFQQWAWVLTGYATNLSSALERLTFLPQQIKIHKKKLNTFIIKIYSLFLNSYNLSCTRAVLFGWKAIRKTWKYTPGLLTPNRKLSIYGGGLLSEWMDTYELN